MVDESNAAIPGADVKLTDTSTNTLQSTISNSDGRFVFSSVPPGTYDITFTKEGFTTYDIKSQVVEIGEVLTLNAKLKVGSTTTTVEVSASIGAELQTMNATVGNTLNKTALMVLPSLGRDVTSMAVLQPAATPSGQVAGPPAGCQHLQLDGANITDDMGGNVMTYQTNFSGMGGADGRLTSGVIPTPSESIEEFKVSVSNQTSDFNNSSGGQIQMMTHRGTNQIHGVGVHVLLRQRHRVANTWNEQPHTVQFGSLQTCRTPRPISLRTIAAVSAAPWAVPSPIRHFSGASGSSSRRTKALRFPNGDSSGEPCRRPCCAPA